MRAISVVTAAVLLACASRAFAQAPPPVPAPAAAPTPAQRATWQRDYGAARQRLLAGDFAAAAAAFETLARTAPSREDAIAAGELGSLAREWDRRGLAFVQRADLGESTLSAKAAGERTGDEISVLYLGAVFYGLGTGAWLAVQTEPESPAEGILPALGLAGAAVGGVYLADNTGPKLPYGVPQSIVSGMTIALEQGLVWSLWNQARVERADEWSGKTVATVIWGSATLGAGVGAAVSLAGSTTPGRAAYVSSAALWGSVVSGFGVAAVSSEDDMQDDRALLGAAIGLNAAAVGGILAAGPLSPSVARVRFIDLGGIGGGLVAGGLYLSGAGDNPDARAGLGITALGITGGLIAAHIFTADMEPDRGVRYEPSRTALSVHPTLTPTLGGGTLGVVGRF